MKNVCVLSLLILFFMPSLFCQTDVQKSFLEYTSDYKEHVYVHLNKDIFLPLETLHFSAYLSDNDDSEIIDESANLEVRLFSEDGYPIDQHVFYIEDGIALGSVLLDYPVGTYYLEIGTHWMRNFANMKPYLKRIKIVNDAQISYTKNLQTVNQTPTLNDEKTSSVQMEVNTLPPSGPIVSVTIDETLLRKMGNNDWQFGYHNNHELQIGTLQLDTIYKVIKLSKTKLFPGINTLLLINPKGELVKERVIYNDSAENLKSHPFDLDILKTTKDSVYLNILTPQSTLSIKHASISIIPDDSVTNSLRTGLQLQKVFQNIDMFDKSELAIPKNRKELFELNERLFFVKNTLDWNLLTAKKDSDSLSLHRGFDISGNINSWLKGSRGEISFYQNNVGQLFTTEVGVEGEFLFENTYIEKADKLNFSIFKNGESVANPTIEFDITPYPILEPIVIPNLTETDGNEFSTIPNLDSDSPTLTDGNILEEVEITGPSKVEEVFTRNEDLANDSFYDRKKINEEDIKKIPSLSGLIRRVGFKPIVLPNGNIFVLSRRRYDPPPAVFVDDIRKFQLFNIQVGDIDEIYSATIGSGFGQEQSKIYIYTRQTPLASDEAKVIALSPQVGFERAKPFVHYDAAIPFDASLKKYGVVYWRGNVPFDQDNQWQLSFPRYGLKSVKIFIEGVWSDGTFFSQEETISFD